MGSIGLVPTNSSSSGPSGGWSNTDGVFGPDGSPAVYTPGSETTSDSLGAGGFPANQIPPGATLVGIQFGGHAWSGVTNTVQCQDIGLTINGISSANLDSTSILGTGVGGGLGFGSPTTVPSGLESVTAADVNTGLLGISLTFQGVGGNPGMSTISCSNWGVVAWFSSASSRTIFRYIVNRPNFEVMERMCWW